MIRSFGSDSNVVFKHSMQLPAVVVHTRAIILTVITLAYVSFETYQ